MAKHPEIPSPEQSAIYDLHSSLVGLIKHNKKLEEYMITQEIAALSNNGSYNAIQYGLFNLNDMSRKITYGQVRLLCGAQSDIPHYNLSMESTPKVAKDDLQYYDQVRIRIYSKIPSVFLDIEPQDIQDEFDENELLNYRKFMSYHVAEGSNNPTWHGIKVPLDDSGNITGQYEYTQLQIPDDTLTEMFFYSATQGCLPGFSLNMHNEVCFNIDSFDRFRPII